MLLECPYLSLLLILIMEGKEMKFFNEARKTAKVEQDYTHATNCNLVNDVARRNAVLFGEKVAVISRDRSDTFEEFYRRANCLGNGLRSLGVKEQDRVAILSRNRAECLECLFGTAACGAVGLPLNTRLADPELVYIINHGEAEILIYEEVFSERVKNISSQLPRIMNYVCMGSAPPESISYEDLISNSSTKEPELTINEDDLYLLLYTSGSTGKPKGVMINHRTMNAGSWEYWVRRNYQPTDFHLNLFPLFHAAGVVSSLAPFYSGGGQVLLEDITPERILECIEEDKVTSITLVPTLLVMILNTPGIEKYDLSSVRDIEYGASPMMVKTLRQAMQVFANANFSSGLGSTEDIGVPCTWLRYEDHVSEGTPEQLKRLGSIGRIGGMTTEIKLLDDNNQEVKQGEVGEFCIRVPFLMSGYWKDPEATEAAFSGGYFHHGDICYQDEDGYYYLVDRKKDMIITGGENVYSQEVEAVIFSHPAVLAVAVIGVPDEKWGEAVKAIVVCKENMKVSEEELKEYCRGKIAGYKIFKSVDFVESIPMTATGKINKPLLREKYGHGYDRKI